MRVRSLAGLAAAALACGVTVGLSVGGTPGTTVVPMAVTTVASDGPAGVVEVLEPAPRLTRAPHAYTPPAPVSFELPPAIAERLASPLATGALTPIPVTIGSLGIPELVLGAYRAAEATLAAEQPGCGVTWHLLAGIGRIESGHAGGGRTDAAGTTVTPILGPRLDGSLAGNNVIRDTDGGAVDGDTTHDRAVGPMQFIPGTWARYAADGNDDGRADPNNVFDASLAAARYLCSGGLDLRDPGQEQRAVLRYNNSMAYAANVIGWSSAYAAGGTPEPGEIREVPVEPGLPAEPTPTPAPAPSDPDALRNAAAPGAPQPLIPGLPALPTLPPLPCLAFCPPA
ncbi:lytic transglycosylase domain-containing protein [Rhodococcus gannanensis]|uniref:Lytic transglycosylase domain-containing protein n=1 Tax=Rhodococcus gannanensis TaxID=1960308 RepID=A0ABW4P0S8_9NOCA